MQEQGTAAMDPALEICEAQRTAAMDPALEICEDGDGEKCRKRQSMFEKLKTTLTLKRSQTESQPLGESFEATAARYKFRIKCLEVYILIFQVRIAYVCLCLAIIIGCLSLSACMQGSFSVAYSDRSQSDIFVAVLAVPVCFALMAYVAGEFMELFWDIIYQKHNPLVRCRSVFLVLVWLMLGDRTNSHRVSQVGLVLSIVFLDAIPFGIALYCGYCTGWMIGPMITGLVRDTAIVSAVVCVFLAVSKVVLRVSGNWHKVQDAMKHFEQHPLIHYCLTYVEQPIQEDTQSFEFFSAGSIKFHASDADEGSYCKPILRRFYFMCFIGMASFMAVTSKNIRVALLCQILFMISIQAFLRRLTPYSYTVTYLVLVVLYIFVVVTSIGFSYSVQVIADDTNIFLEPAHKQSWRSASSLPNYSSMVGFRLCAERWGRDVDNRFQLNIFDFLVMADSVYANKCEGDGSVYEKISKAVEGTYLEDFKLEECQGWQNISRYVVIYFPKVKKRVLAIRGTQITDEVIANADLMSSVALLTAVKPIVNFELVLDLRTIRWILAKCSVQIWFGNRRYFWWPHIQKAKYLKQKSLEAGDDLFVTGHSLGGTFAAVVGGRLGIHAVAFNPPGQRWMLERYGIKHTEQLQMYLTVVQPIKDLVALIDRQVGNIHQLPCAASCKWGKCYFECHQMSVETCQLYSACGDPRGRVLTGDLRTYCENINVPTKRTGEDGQGNAKP